MAHAETSHHASEGAFDAVRFEMQASLPSIVDKQVSADGSRKYVLALRDGQKVEAVGMPQGDVLCPERLTVCFSTQVGCAMGCAFCATGKQGFARNLTADEMVGQILLVGNDFGCRPNTVLAMGQGEPLLNADALLEAFAWLSSPSGLGLGPQRLMVSTCGILDGITRIADAGVGLTLNVSLHAATQKLRDELMPGVRHAPLEELKRELSRYNSLTGRRVIVQYLMLAGINDDEGDLASLCDFCHGLDAFVVLLRHNHVEGTAFEASPPATVAYWLLALKRAGIPAIVNRPRGADIAGGCGQLVNKVASHVTN